MGEECCKNCVHIMKLKCNFTRETGFKETHCCAVLFFLEDSYRNTPYSCEPWVQEVSEDSMCEMFTPKVKKEVKCNDEGCEIC